VGSEVKRCIVSVEQADAKAAVQLVTEEVARKSLVFRRYWAERSEGLRPFLEDSVFKGLRHFVTHVSEVSCARTPGVLMNMNSTC
jgi:hypothetical protein